VEKGGSKESGQVEQENNQIYSGIERTVRRKQYDSYYSKG
jgi:hypothetical protein